MPAPDPPLVLAPPTPAPPPAPDVATVDVAPMLTVAPVVALAPPASFDASARSAGAVNRPPSSNSVHASRVIQAQPM
jgi:hypothetical protein